MVTDCQGRILHQPPCSHDLRSAKREGIVAHFMLHFPILPGMYVRGGFAQETIFLGMSDQQNLFQ